MKIVANTLTGILMLLIFSNATFAEERTQKYVQISNSRQADSEKIIIYEFFWYGCPHCYNIEPTIDKIESNLKEDTLLVRLPLALRDSWVNHAKAFFALEKMGKTSDLHEKIFEIRPTLTRDIVKNITKRIMENELSGHEFNNNELRVTLANLVPEYTPLGKDNTDPIILNVKPEIEA